MKKYFIPTMFMAGIVFLNLSCNLTGRNTETKLSAADSALAAANAPVIQFAEENFDFGKLKEGDVVEHKFKFKNIGKSPLQIQNVQVQCGCTVASKPTEPVGIGQESEIVVSFNSEGKAGINKKFVTVFSNANPPQSIISFTAEVLSKNLDKEALEQKAEAIKKL